MTKRSAPDRIEAGMKKISLWVSFISLALMITGFVLSFLYGNTYSLPGSDAPPIGRVLAPPWPPRTLDSYLMSLGIVLLSLLPSARLLLAVGVYLSSLELTNVTIGLVVLLELLLSLRLSL